MSALVRAARRLLALRRTTPEREFSKDRVIWYGPRIAGVWMTHEEALRLSAVWACVSVISKALASCRWDVYREDAKGDRESVSHTFGIWRLLNLRPNPETTAFAFREAAYIVALIYGNFYAEIERDVAGRPTALWPLSPDRCCLERDPATNRLQLRVRNRETGETLLEYDDVFHLHGPGIDGVTGFDTVTIAARALGSLAAMERFNLAFYSNGTSMGGVLSTDSPLTPERVAELREQVNERTGGPDKAFQFLVLHGGLKWQSLSVEPEKAQFVEGKIQSVLDICRWFGVPPHKIAELSRSTFSNIEHQGLEFVRDALTPWAERAAQEADWKLILANDFGTRIELEWLAEGDAKSKAETDSILVQNGLLRRNESRKRRGLNSLGPDGDMLTVQANLTLLEMVGQNFETAGDSPPAPANDDAPAERAARAIFAGTMRQAYERFKERRCDENALRDHAQYVGTKIGDAIAVLERCGVTFDDEALRAALAAQVEEDGAANGFDPSARANDVAAMLAGLIRKG